MRRLWPRSLQAQLALRLVFVFLAATTVGIETLFWEGRQAANTAHNGRLLARAGELAHSVEPLGGGRIRVDLSQKSLQRYDATRAANLYAIRLPRGNALVSTPNFAALVGRWPMATDKPRYFHLEDFGKGRIDYYGVTILERTAAGLASITVAHASDADEVAEALFAEFVRSVAWLLPLFAAVTLAIGIWSIRQGLRAVSAVSQRAAKIDPGSTGVRLPLEGLPTELVPLVRAVNQAFDRLEKGIEMQRRFTADAAHELRTPLTMLTAGLDDVAADQSVETLRSDATRMNRLVDQLLRAARLDATPVNVSEPVNLSKIAAQVVEYLAPWAISRRRELGLDAPDQPVMVKGNADAISDALRNIIENAVYHAPVGTEVSVVVFPDGAVTVADSGPGIPAEDRQHIFERFWRGRNPNSTGAGLGLSIVAEIVRIHGGRIDVADAPRGGALFKLTFRTA
ncbi:MAG TPA: ATP-binding protein [Rhizomicrobium sp.]|nr:ATP-binding protein [Rhizomicrobium sp.]